MCGYANVGSPPGRNEAEVRDYYKNICGLSIDQYLDPEIDKTLGRGNLAVFNFVPQHTFFVPTVFGGGENTTATTKSVGYE